MNDYPGRAFLKVKPAGAKPKPAKSEQPKARRSRRKRANITAAADDREAVYQRQGWICFGWGVNPGCIGKVQDPHELIPVGRGGPRVSWNRVGLCRHCHRMGQGRIGGNLLIFDWPGKADGRKPNADQPGNVTCRWRGQRDTQTHGRAQGDRVGRPGGMQRGRGAAAGHRGHPGGGGPVVLEVPADLPAGGAGDGRPGAGGGRAPANGAGG